MTAERPPTDPLTIDPAELADNVSVLPSDHERDEMAVPSYSHWNPVVRRLFRARLRDALGLLAPRTTDRVLDFGSGSGVLLPALAASCARVFACDLFPEPARRMVEQRGLANVEVLDVPLPTLADVGGEPLDAVVALDVLEHVDDVAATIERFADLLRPGGRLVTSAPTETVIYRAGRVLAGFGGKGHYHHTDGFDIDATIARSSFVAAAEQRLFRAPLPQVFMLRRFELPTG